MYVPPVMKALKLAAVEDKPKNNNTDGSSYGFASSGPLQSLPYP